MKFREDKTLILECRRRRNSKENTRNGDEEESRENEKNSKDQYCSVPGYIVAPGRDD